MSHFNFKEELKKQILIREGWEAERDRQEKENSPLDGMAGEYGLTSRENSNSLLSLLDEYQEEQKKLGKEEFTDEQKVEIVGIIRVLAKKKGIALEEQEVNLTGLRSERDRHLPSQDILNLLNKIGLVRDDQVEIAKIIDKWGKLNSVKFVKGGASAAHTPEPEKSPGVPEDAPEDAPEAKKDAIDLRIKAAILRGDRRSVKALKRWIRRSLSASTGSKPDEKLIDGAFELMKTAAKALKENRLRKTNQFYRKIYINTMKKVIKEVRRHENKK